MLRLLGTQIHPAISAVIGIAALVLGLVEDLAVVAVVGGVLLLVSAVRGIGRLRGGDAGSGGAAR